MNEWMDGQGGSGTLENRRSGEVRAQRVQRAEDREKMQMSPKQPDKKMI